MMLLLLILGLLATGISCMTVSSCPSHGCQPSGTYSYFLNLPSASPKVIWNTTYDAIPGCLGCVGNINNIVCPYKGEKSNGYVTIDNEKGTQSWYVKQLHNPVLPIMDITGGIIGTDGHVMVKYLPDGTQIKPNKPVDSRLYPLYSIEISDNGILVFASMSGIMFTMDTAGIPHASISFNGTVERANGTFIPVSTPVIAGNRIYLLTEFLPDEDTPYTRQPHILGMQRLYAIDIYLRMVDRLDTVWYVNFERESTLKLEDEVLRFKPKRTVAGDPRIMVNVASGVVYVILPEPQGDENSYRMFWAIKDNGNDTSLLFKLPLAASAMAMYEGNGVQKPKPNWGVPPQKSKLLKFLSGKVMKTELNPVWLLSETKNAIYKLDPLKGTIEMTINLTSILQGSTQVTSDIMVLRKAEDALDNIVFGVSVKSSTSEDNFLASIQADGKLLWKVPTPSNTGIVGQIAGISAEGTNSDDMLVAFGNKDKTATVFAVQ